MTRHRFLSRLVLFATMLVLLAAFYFAAVMPLSKWRQETLETQSAKQYERVKLEASIARLEAEKRSYVSDDLAGLTWEGQQAAEATAKVQSAVNDMARRNGILMRSVAPTRPSETTLENAITFRLEFEASLDQLVIFLKTLEFGRPALIVTRANMRRLVRPNQSGTQPDLFVQIDIAAPTTLAGETPG